jgi:hypothetical protein
MALLARRNLLHDRIRFAVTLTGIVFALVLIIVQFGLCSLAKSSLWVCVLMPMSKPGRSPRGIDGVAGPSIVPILWHIRFGRIMSCAH